MHHIGIVGRVATSIMFGCMFWIAFALSSQNSFAAESAGDPKASDVKTAEVLAPLHERFAIGKQTDEVPDFQKHITPLLGRLGCNGRACHGSFQGRGGFQLSLFGYDFEADHKAMLAAETGRIDSQDIDESLILAKPSDEDLHEGGKRFDRDGWQYRVLRSWIASGAEYDAKQRKMLERLEVSPSEILFNDSDAKVTLHAIAVWEDGSREDVSGLCRFHTNDEAIAEIDEQGVVRSTGTGDTHVVVSYDNAVVPIPVLRPVSKHVGKDYPQQELRTEVDRLIASKLEKLGVLPSGICTDAEFLRRASLDISGTLPTAAQAEAFLADTSSDKRQRKIEELLNSPGYAAWWTTRFCDWTGNSELQLNNVSPVGRVPVEHWYQWIYKRLQDNVPYDELVEGIVVAQSRKEGESYLQYCQAMSDACRKGQLDEFADRPGLTYFWARRNFRQTEDRAIGFAYSFLGIRIQCAQCHKHPFDQWSKQDFDDFKNLFQTATLSQKPRSDEDLKQYEAMMASVNSDAKGNDLRRMLAKEFENGKTIPFPELIDRPVRGQTKTVRKQGKKAQRIVEPVTAKLLGGDYVELDEDARGKLMTWLRAPENPYFAKAIVNRVWANYFGYGIVNPVDDLNLANPPSNGPLMDYLAQGFVENNYDLKWLHRTIVSSDAYQRSWEANETNALDKRNFSRFVPRRLPAETLYDAILVATANDANVEQFCSSMEGRAVSMPGTGGRNARNGAGYALQVFGRSIRESNCDCDRSEEPNLLQTVYLQNDDDVRSRLLDRNGWIAEQMKSLGVSMSGSVATNDRAAERLEQARKQQLAQLTKRKRELEKSLKQLTNSDAEAKPQTERQIQKAKLQIAQIEKRMKSLDSGKGSPDSVAAAESAGKQKSIDKEKLQALVTEAYLRTLSRYPESEEMQASLSFIESSESAADGVADVMWALINTKEFVLNH